MEVMVSKETERILKAAADGTRLRILGLLERGPLCVCQLVELLQLSQSTVSKHLWILDVSGLVESDKQGKWVFYRLPRRGADPRVRTLLHWLSASLESSPQLARDLQNLEKKLLSGFSTACPAPPSRRRFGPQRPSSRPQERTPNA